MSSQLTVNIDESLTDLIPGFLERKRADIVSIIEAASRHDYDAMAHVAHRLKGEGGSYGFDRMTELAWMLEQALKARDDGQIAARAHELLDYIDRVEVVYRPSED